MTGPGISELPEVTRRAVHEPRPVRFAGLHRLDEWQVKLYGVAVPGERASTAFLDAALRKADEVLPRPARAEGRYGLGFVVAHQAADFGFVLVAWWYGENEIHQKVFSSSLDDLTALKPHFNDAMGCIWELSATDFERRAWIEHVLANPAGPDVAAYLAAEFNADV